MRAAAEQAGSSLERSLLDNEILSMEDLLSIYSDVFQIRFLKLEDVEIDRAAVRHVPAAVAHRHHVIPVRRSGNSLMVALADPTNPEALNALHAVTDFDILPFVAAPDAIEHAIYLHYGEPTVEASAAAVDQEGASLFRLQHLLSDDRFGHMAKSLLINRAQTFAAFVEDHGNQRALHIASSALAGTGGELFNPVLFYGQAGAGKTHLLHAMANRIIQQSPLKRLVAATADCFAENLFECARDGKLGFFRYVYRSADLLLLDDADALLHRPWAQRELAATIEALHADNRQIVMAARSNLIEDPDVIAELRNRLRAGLAAEIEPFTAEGKHKLLGSWAKGATLATDDLKNIAGDADSNLHVLRMRLQAAVLEKSALAMRLDDDFAAVCTTE